MDKLPQACDNWGLFLKKRHQSSAFCASRATTQGTTQGTFVADTLPGSELKCGEHSLEQFRELLWHAQARHRGGLPALRQDGLPLWALPHVQVALTHTHTQTITRALVRARLIPQPVHTPNKQVRVCVRVCV